MEVIDEVVDKTTVKKKKVIIGLPGNKFSSRFLVSWTSALNTLWENGKYDIVISPGVSSFVSFARMQTLGLNNLRGIDQKPFDGMDFDLFITIDSDIIFLPQNLLELIEATEQHSVVSGVYRMTDLKSMAVVSEWDINYFKKEGSFKYLTHEDLDNWKKNNENEKFMKVAYCGMGFMAITKEALYSLNYPYFQCELQEFRGTDGKLIREICSEDVAFCKNLEKSGHYIYVIPDLRVGHEKELVI